MTETQKKLSDIITIKGSSIDYSIPLGAVTAGGKYTPITGCFSLLGDYKVVGVQTDFCYNDQEIAKALGGNIYVATDSITLTEGLPTEENNESISLDGNAGIGISGLAVVGVKFR